MLKRPAGMGMRLAAGERLLALVGNPNTGKSTLFNALTGLRQHTGNWPGKTVARREGSFRFQGRRYRVVDLPGAYSLIPTSPEEEITRDFLMQGQPDCTIVVADATALERNLNLALQLIKVTPKAVLCLNLVDEARRSGLEVDVEVLSQALGVPAVATVARTGEGLDQLMQRVEKVSDGEAPAGPGWPAGCPWGEETHDAQVARLYAQAEETTRRAVKGNREGGRRLDQRIDRFVISPIFGFPLMLALLAGVFWITIVGANYPSNLLASALFRLEAELGSGFERLGLPWWLTGFLWHGVYRGLAWVVSVMLPPMAIFFPLFTALEDLGYLPRVAFNLDWLFRKVGGHGKQALTMAMGFGCNAAGVIAARVIDSPRERLLAILTNTFVPCNGRFPTLIMMATLFVAAVFPPALASLAAAGAVLAAVLFGAAVTLAVCWGLSRTLLKGTPSAFILELPPYRRPDLLRILYTSLIDRTVFVLGRAVMIAAPAGGAIWILSNIAVGDRAAAQALASWLDPLGAALGLDGVILVAYLIAIPANEIVVPTMLMIYMGLGMMTELPSLEALRTFLLQEQGWTLLTAVNLMLFAVLHNPCGTTLWTIWKETGSGKWTAFAALLPLSLAFAVTFLVASAVGLLGGP